MRRRQTQGLPRPRRTLVHSSWSARMVYISALSAWPVLPPNTTTSLMLALAFTGTWCDSIDTSRSGGGDAPTRGTARHVIDREWCTLHSRNHSVRSQRQSMPPGPQALVR